MVLAARTAHAQTPPPNPAQVPNVTTEIVRIDVVVTDRGGKARQGLRREDFVVLEDGQPQQITGFAAFAGPQAPAAPTGATQAPAAESPPAVAAPNARRYVVLVVDDIHTEAANLIQLRKTLDRFLNTSLGSEDQVALVTTSGARSQEFTDDRHALSQVVARLSPQMRRMTPTGVPHITEYQAERIERGDREALGLAVAEIQAARLSSNAEMEARAVARAVFAECIQNARSTLGTLENVVRGMSDLRGRKVVILASDGFLIGLGADSTVAFDLRRIADAATRSGVIVYSLDTKGLVALSPGLSASSRMSDVPGDVGGVPPPDATATSYDARQRLEREGEGAIRDAMNALAVDTGGFLATDTNKLGEALRRILKDTETYYLIAYEPAPAIRDGRFRRIEVRLPGVRGVRVRHRTGYFCRSNRDNDSRTSAGLSDPTGERSAQQPGDRAASEMKSALLSPSPLTAIPLGLSVDFVSIDAKQVQVAVSAQVDLRPVLFHRAGDRRLATVTVAGVVFDQSGAIVGSLPSERAALELTDAEFERAIEAGLAYQHAAPVTPGRYRVRVAVREDGQGRLGSASQWIEAPDLADGKLILSSLFLFKEGDAKGAVASASADGSPLRSVQAERQFHREENLYVQFFAYNVRRDAGGATNLVAVAEVWRGGKRLASSAPEPMAASEGGAPPQQLRSVMLRAFEPGQYDLRIVVTDEMSHTTVSASAAFTIE
jgi:VWFA-related protein